MGNTQSKQGQVQSFVEFAKANDKTCQVCALPEDLLKELQSGYDQGYRYAAMSNWLEGVKGVTVTLEKLGNHFRRHHARK